MVSKADKWAKGKYYPIYPEKYKGNLNKIVFRSSWELKLFKYCDLAENVLEWTAEEVVVPYNNPITGRKARYFVDVYMKHRLSDGTIKKKLIEVKPRKQTKEPRVPKRKTKKYLREVQTWMINKSKWEAAHKYASKRGMDFVIFTENELGIN